VEASLKLGAILTVLTCGLAIAGCSRTNSSALPPIAGSNVSRLLEHTRVTPDATVKAIYSFGKVPYDGSEPMASLVAMNGILFGSTSLGGTNNDGTIFSVSPKGAEKILHSFDFADGDEPYSELLFFDGMFYGTTRYGGTDNEGTIYRVGPNGVFKLLYSFKADYHDGNQPVSGLIALNGKLYGTTSQGGPAVGSCGGTAGCGTVFSVTPSGVEHVLYTFKGTPDGSDPVATLTTVNGTLYGTTEHGGKVCCAGTVFRITTGGKETILHSFNGLDGSLPNGRLLYLNTELYGTTLFGGSSNGRGAIFKVNLSGKEQTIYQFVGGAAGCYPGGLVTLHGRLYGTTYGASDPQCPDAGTAYVISTSGSLSTLHTFNGGEAGANPFDPSGLTLLSGKLYGTTSLGGYHSAGTTFSLSP
jgi:uncharacterized repeat protein (TIGR03803 family)